MAEEQGEPIQRWTAKRRVALVLYTAPLESETTFKT